MTMKVVAIRFFVTIVRGNGRGTRAHHCEPRACTEHVVHAKVDCLHRTDY